VDSPRALSEWWKFVVASPVKAIIGLLSLLIVAALVAFVNSAANEAGRIALGAEDVSSPSMHPPPPTLSDREHQSGGTRFGEIHVRDARTGVLIEGSPNADFHSVEGTADTLVHVKESESDDVVPPGVTGTLVCSEKFEIDDSKLKTTIEGTDQAVVVRDCGSRATGPRPKITETGSLTITVRRDPGSRSPNAAPEN
jgi:hypothetical protein